MGIVDVLTCRKLGYVELKIKKIKNKKYVIAIDDSNITIKKLKKIMMNILFLF